MLISIVFSRFYFFIVMMAVLLFLSAQVRAAGQSDKVPVYVPAYVPGEVLVTLKPTVIGVQFRRDIPGIAAMHKLSHNLHRIQLQPDETVISMIARLKKNSLVAAVQPNYIKYLQLSDRRYEAQWALNNTGQTGGIEGADIKAVLAWSVTTGAREVVVAVIDTGIDGGADNPHPDLVASLWRNKGEIPDNGIDDDGNGCVDDVIGCNVVDPAHKTNDVIDKVGHGTLIAGVIAASQNNDIGISGISPGVSLMIIKAFEEQVSSTAKIVAAVDYAIAMGADIINASYGVQGVSVYGAEHFDYAEYESMEKARQAGLLIVLPAGNGNSDNIGFDNDDTENVLAYVPASYDLDNIVAVAATDHNDELSLSSNWGASSVDLAAPGIEIISTYLDGGYATSSGTSLAVPYVTGTLALMLSIEGDHSIEALKNLLLDGVDPVTALSSRVSSGGRLNAWTPLAAEVHVKVQSETRNRQLSPGGGGLMEYLFLLLILSAVVMAHHCRSLSCRWLLRR